MNNQKTELEMLKETYLQMQMNADSNPAFARATDAIRPLLCNDIAYLENRQRHEVKMECESESLRILAAREAFPVQLVGKWIDIYEGDASEDLRNLLARNGPDYTDNSDSMREHLYSPHTTLEEVDDMDEEEKPTDEVLNQLKDLADLANKHDAAYVRFINH